MFKKYLFVNFLHIIFIQINYTTYNNSNIIVKIITNGNHLNKQTNIGFS